MKQYKHKQTGVIATQSEQDERIYYITPPRYFSIPIPSLLVETDEWEEIKDQQIIK